MDETDLLAMISKNPRDEALRLAWADWLDLHGGDPARARLVRVQIEQARHAREHGGPCTRHRCVCWFCQLGRSANSILEKDGFRWVCPGFEMAAIQQLKGIPVVSYDRGMASVIELPSVDDWKVLGPEIRRHQPLAEFIAADVEAVRLYGASPDGYYLRLAGPEWVGPLAGWLAAWMPPGQTVSFLDPSQEQRQNVRVTITIYNESRIYQSAPLARAAISLAIQRYADMAPRPA